MKFGIGQSVRRFEDPRLLRGKGAYLDDAEIGGALRAVFLRSPVAHARIRGIDAEAARTAPGVAAVILGAELDEAGVNDLGAMTVPDRNGTPAPRPRHPVIASDRVRYVGNPVALVLAESLAEARDAAERIEVDYEELPAIADTARAEQGPVLHDEMPGNLAYHWVLGDENAVGKQLAAAAHRVELELINNRVAACALEPRSAIGEWDAAAGKLHLEVGTQNAWRVQAELAERFGLAAEQVRITTGDVGGGFGSKAMAHPEYTAIAFAARRTGRPVRWVSDRSEAFLSDVMGRDHVTRAVAGFDAELRLLALRVDNIAAMGAYLSPLGASIPSVLMAKILPGAYDFEHLFFSVRGVYTNTPPVDAYRGAGRPEGIYVIERVMDLAARQLGTDPFTLRERNFIPPDRFPYHSASGEVIDIGNFPQVLARARKEADTDGFPARREESARRGRLRGLGVSYYTEIILGAMDERAVLMPAGDGIWELRVGTQAQGQGHETAYRQILHGQTGLPPDRIRIVHGDTDLIPKGGGTGGSRSVTAQGTAIRAAGDRLIERLREDAGDALEAGTADIEFEAGSFRIVGTDRAIDLPSLADTVLARGDGEKLRVDAHTTLPGRSFPNGCHVCEIEIDPETGAAAVLRYTAVDDFGVLINPMLVEGQVQGGVAQGIGQAILEHATYDDAGQPQAGSFMDYALPRATDIPPVAFHSEPLPSTANQIGMKGCGEAGTVGALPSVANAALDALWPLGVRQVDMPLTPARIWGWIRDASKRGAD